jgi:hypothetical protein
MILSSTSRGLVLFPPPFGHSSRPQKMFVRVSTNCRSADAEISSRNPMPLCPVVDGFSTPSLLRRAAIYGVPRHLSACLALGGLALSSPAPFLSLNLATLLHGHSSSLTPHPPSFHCKFADTDASSSANPAPTSHATTLPATREELQHRWTSDSAGNT